MNGEVGVLAKNCYIITPVNRREVKWVFCWRSYTQIRSISLGTCHISDSAIDWLGEGLLTAELENRKKFCRCLGQRNKVSISKYEIFLSLHVTDILAVTLIDTFSRN